MNRELLVGVGGCLLVLGFVMRSLARSHRREQALRRQHERASVAKDRDRPPDAIDRHLEKWMPRYGGASIVVGFGLIGLAWLV